MVEKLQWQIQGQNQFLTRKFNWGLLTCVLEEMVVRVFLVFFYVSKAQRTQGIESLNFIKFAKPIKRIRSNSNLVLFGKGQVKHIKFLIIPCYKIG